MFMHDYNLPFERPYYICLNVRSTYAISHAIRTITYLGGVKGGQALRNATEHHMM